MSITRYFDLYLNAGKTIPLVINANQYDESEEWVFTLYSDTGVKYTPSSGAIVGIKPDGYLIANAGTVDEQGRVVIAETQQMTAAAGKAIFELQIDNDTHGTANFIVLVEPDPSNNGIASGSDIGLLRDALNGGLSQAAIEALLACFENVAWIGDDGQDYYDALEAALNAVRGISLDVSTLSFVGAGQTQQLTATTIPAGGTVSWESSNTSVATVSSSGLVTSTGVGTATITASSGDVSATCSVTVTQATLVSIDAVYTQSGTVYTTDSLDSLKTDLVVTATWSNSSTSTVASTDYTLSGTLAAGTSTITVTYNDKTDSFTVTVTAVPVVSVTYTQGSIGAGNSDANRVTGVITSGVHLDTETLQITVPSGYSLYPFGVQPTSNDAEVGTRKINNVLYAYMKSDSGYVVPGNQSYAGTLSAASVNLWNKSDAGWKTGTVTYSFAKSGEYGYTFTGLGFLIKEDNNANITPSEIEELLTFAYGE